jgi:hypothetical protein
LPDLYKTGNVLWRTSHTLFVQNNKSFVLSVSDEKSLFKIFNQSEKRISIENLTNIPARLSSS